MATTFSPLLNTNVGYQQPVAQPSAMSAVVDLFNFGMKSLSTQASASSSLTEDEKFAVAMREFESSKGAAFQWDSKGWREFVFTYPQFASQAKSTREVITPPSPLEASQDAVMDWAKTPEGIAASAIAFDMPEEEAMAYLSEQFTIQKNQEAAIAKLERNNAQLTAEGTLVTHQWEALKPAAKSFTDNVVQLVVAPIVTDVAKGATFDVPEELKMQFGLKYDTVDMSNLSLFLNDVKIYLSNKSRGDFYNNFGSDALPSEDWNKSVLGSLEPMIKISESFDTPQEQAAAMSALIEADVYRKLDDAGLAATMQIFKIIPPDIAGMLISKEGLVDSISGLLADKDGNIFKDMEKQAQAASDMSVSEAKAATESALKLVEKGFTPEFFTAFQEAAKRSGYDVIDNASFKSIISSNITEINKSLNENSEFKTRFTDWLSSDVQQTISIIQESLPENVLLLSDENGKFYLQDNTTYTRARGGFVKAFGGDVTASQISALEKSLPEGMNLQTLNEKIASLNLLGETGIQIKEAIGILNKDTKKSSGGTSERSRARGRNSGRAAEGTSNEDWWTPIKNGIFAGESGGDYDALFGYQNRPGGKFENVKLTEMTVDEAIAFSSPSGEYGQWVKGEIGRVATPLGAYQVVGTTLRAAKEGLGLTGNEVMDEATQDRIGMWIYETQGTGAWEGYQGPLDHAPSHARRAEASIPTIPIDTSKPTGPAATGAPTESLGRSYSTAEVQQVQQIAEMVKSDPEEAVRLAKEVLAGKPMDPMVKSLIEALVAMGERV